MVFGLKKDHFYLKKGDNNIFVLCDAWLNCRIVDGSLTLICKTLGTQEHFQSILNCQKKAKPYKTVNTQNYFTAATITGF